MIAVRAAADSDHRVLEHMREQARAEISLHRGGVAMLAELDAGRGDAQAVSWLAELDGYPVGFVGAWLELDLGIARLVGPWVEPGARGVGAGEELIAAAIAWARERGARALDASALPGDRLTKRSLESGHFVTRLLVLRRTL